MTVYIRDKKPPKHCFSPKKSLKELLKKIEQETCQVFLCETSFSPLSEIQEDRKINLKQLKFFFVKAAFQLDDFDL